MKNSWKTEKLIDVFHIKPSKNEVKYRLSDNYLVSFVPMEDLGILAKDFTTTKEKHIKEVSGSYTYFSNNDVLLAKITPCFENGKLGIARNLKNGIGFGSSEFIVFRSNGQIIPEYLFYLLCTNDFRERGKKRMSGAVGHKRIQKEFIENYLISFPESIEEQQRIVAILDKSFSAIDKAKSNMERNLKNAKELFESDLRRVFENMGEDWDELKLIDITTKIGSGATPRGGNKSYKTHGIYLIRSMNVHDFEFREKNLAFIDEQQAKELNNVAVQENDVLLNITGASVARCCIIPKKYLPARVNQHVSIIRAKQEIIDPIFLNLLLTSKFYKDQLLFTGEQGATRQAITKAQLEVFKVAFPKSLKAQQDIVKKLDTLSTESKKLVAIHQAKIHELDALKKSILQQAFSGELTTENIDIDTQVQA